MRSRLSMGLLAGSVIALVAGYACQDDGAIAPHSWIQADLEPVPPDSGAELGTYTLPTPPNNNVAYPEVNTGIALPAGMYVRVTVHGKLTFTPNPDWPACAHYAVPALPGGGHRNRAGGRPRYVRGGSLAGNDGA